MKLLIRLFLLLVIVLLFVLMVWGKPILEGISSHVLKTPVNINKAKFVPYKLTFELHGINIPKKNLIIPSGTIRLVPPRLEFYGLKFMDNIILDTKQFSVSISLYKHWEINALFSGIDLSKLNYSFKKGELSGTIDGTYAKRNCEFYGLVNLSNIIYSDRDAVILGMSSEELEDIINARNGHIELDFAYRGPIDKMDELNRYAPGRKTMALIKTYVVDKIFK